MLKAYISPSTQEHNAGPEGYIEEIVMNEIADILVPRAIALGFTIRRNKPTMTLDQVIDDSNAWKPDFHVAIHSNAGKAKGAEVWAYSTTSKGATLAKDVYSELAALTPWADRGVKYSGNKLGETARTTAPAIIIETDFHDVLESARWIRANKKAIAEAILKGMCKFAGITYKAETTPKPTPNNEAALKAKIADLETQLEKANSAKVFAEREAQQAKEKLVKYQNYFKLQKELQS